MYSEDYSKYIMENCNPLVMAIPDGDSLVAAMEMGYLFDEFLDSRGDNECCSE